MDLLELEISKKGNTHPWELARLKIVEKLIKKTGSQNNSILDIGCGDAFIISELAAKKPKRTHLAYDINYTEQQLTLLSSKHKELNNLFIANNINTFSASLKKESTVLLLDVIEHIENDFAFLSEIKTIVPKNSTFLITVPAFQSLFSSHDTFLGHYRRYNKKQLTDVLKKSGYSVSSCNYFFSTLLLPRYVKKVLERKAPESNMQIEGVSNWAGGKLLTHLVKILLIADFHISEILSKVGIKTPGLSLYCICKPIV